MEIILLLSFNYFVFCGIQKRKHYIIESKGDLMIIRDNYLSKIKPFYDVDLIKVITGISRCGKSVILLQIIDEVQNVKNFEPVL